MIRMLLTLLFVGALAGGAYASAAALSIDGSSVQAGSDISLTCDVDSDVDLTYTVAFLGGEFKVTTVTVSGISSPECNGKFVTVQPTDGGAVLGAGGVSAAIAGTSVVVDIADVSAELMDDIHVVIN